MKTRFKNEINKVQTEYFSKEYFDFFKTIVQGRTDERLKPLNKGLA